MQAELEDLCFAVTQPQEFNQVHSDLCTLWGVSGFMDDPEKKDAVNEEEEVLVLGYHPAPTVPVYLGVAEVSLPSTVVTHLDEPELARGRRLAGRALDGDSARRMQTAQPEARASVDAQTAVLERPVATTSSTAAVTGGVLLGGGQHQHSEQASASGVEPHLDGGHRADGRDGECQQHNRTGSEGMDTQRGPEGAPSTSHSDRQHHAASSGNLKCQAAEPEGPVSGSGGAPWAEEDTRTVSWETLDSEDCMRMLACVNPFTSVMFSWSGPDTDVCFGLRFLRRCTEDLLQDISIMSYCAGYNIKVYGRVKSLYSTYKKMRRKEVGVKEVYDVLALRIIVDDEEDEQRTGAQRVCYQLLANVERLWKPVRSELDDYIVNPKDSGYQSLHTSVIGPDGVPFEVQIRTSSMHNDAEYGTAAHWSYKELPLGAPRERQDGRGSVNCRVGQPVVRIKNGQYFDGVIVACDEDARHILVAVNLREKLARPKGRRMPLMRDYQGIMNYVEKMGWYEAGQGDINVGLEEYVLCVDGAYHKVDHYGHKQQVVARPIDASKEELLAESSTESTNGGGRDARESAAGSRVRAQKGVVSGVQQEIDRKAHHLRQMLDFCEEIHLECRDSEVVHVMVWPDGQIRNFPRGTTAGEVLQSGGSIQIVDEDAEAHGPVSKLVNVNNQLVHEETKLKDGDYVILSRDLVKI